MVQLVIPFTRGGVSCLTPAQLDQIVSTTTTSYRDGQAPCVLSFSVFDAYGALKACTALGQSYAAFCGYKDDKKYRTIMTIRQAWIGAHSPAPLTETAVVGESEAGRVTLDMNAFVKAVGSFRPTWCLPIYAPVSVEDPPTKKNRTATLRTTKWFEAANAVNSQASIVAVPASLVLTKGVEYNQSPLVFLDAAGQGESLGARTALVSKVSSIPALVKADEAEEDNANPSPAATPSPALPTFVIAESIPAVLLSAAAGASFIECEYAFACARRGQALNLSSLVNAILSNTTDGTVDDTFVMDLNDQMYQLDTTPFATGCPCYSCARHTKAYAYHLLSVQEMNSETLLTIHNLTQVLLLCDAINRVEDRKVARINRALTLLVPS